ncbi:platelet-activating factor acetylhydrolase [Hygrophoropsis aurantiaca]|uniref:Platelet-activating factor acetylhydrolase n=1 Tax=Hygrophoropsis aurantiaca TaxID=72124 RepID=A0ACB8A9B3_9AGAM|nr:platelet-activating factor acetylhydrolase [Hygrophoropsis aurantiaca]
MSSEISPDESPHISSVPKRTPFGAFFSRTLPNYSGKYPVGVRDVELPISKQSFGNFRHKSMPAAEAGVTIDTVFFTLFYPADPDSQSTHDVVWFPRLRQTIDGFIKMAKRTPNWVYRTIAYPCAAAAIWRTTFPGIENAQLRQPPRSGQWPLMIFSHGAGCSRLMYSAFCGEMASRGFVVVAIEHRDGTGPSSQITDADGQTKNFDWLNWTDLQYVLISVTGFCTNRTTDPNISWVDMADQPLDDTTLRHVQLEVRLAEIDQVSKALQSIANGQPARLMGLKCAPFDWARWTSVNPYQPVMVGHSLGGSAAMAAAIDSRFAFSRVVVFDPAVQRLEPWKGRIDIPFLAINSEEFSLGSEFTKLLNILPTVPSRHVFLIPGSTHPSFSDVFLILPDFINRFTGLAVDPLAVINLSVEAVNEFLVGNVGQVCKGKTAIEAGQQLTKNRVGNAGEMVWYRT